MRRGFSLPELTVVLALIAVAGSVTLPALRSRLDTLAVHGAREAAARSLARARAEAPLRGGAAVRFEEPGRIFLVFGEEVREEVDLERIYGARLEVQGAASAAEIRYDALGIGRWANRTLRFRRGNSEASLVISAYGRVSRR